MPLDTVAPPTRAAWVDAQLRRSILGGELRPGAKLYAERLAEQWGVSPTPVRESFQRLAGEGLVVLEPQRGARVAPISVRDAAEMYELRLVLDPMALDQSMAAGADDPAYLNDVDRAHRALVSRHRSARAFQAVHRGFHLALVSRCPSSHLVRLVTQLLDQSQRFHAIGLATVRPGNPADEHRLLLEAVRADDRPGAVAVLRSHLEHTLAAVRTSAG
jgi:GntR family transcriptional regulator, carbon starvation induced regulator